MSLTFSRVYLVLAISLFCVELAIALYVHDSIIRPFFGDVLVIVLIYCMLRTFLKGDPTKLGFAVFLFGCLVEVLQYFDYVALLHLENNRVLSVMMGRTFAWGDFLAYFVGYLFILAGERWASK